MAPRGLVTRGAFVGAVTMGELIGGCALGVFRWEDVGGATKGGGNYRRGGCSRGSHKRGAIN